MAVNRFAGITAPVALFPFSTRFSILGHSIEVGSIPGGWIGIDRLHRYPLS